MSDDGGGPSEVPDLTPAPRSPERLSPSTVVRPSPEAAMEERARIGRRFDELKERGLKFRKPKMTQPLGKLRERLQEFEADFAKMDAAAVKPKPKPKSVPPQRPKPKSAAPKPKSAPQAKKKVTIKMDDDDYTSDEDNVPGPKRRAHKGAKPVLHTLYYSGLAAGGRVAEKLGRPEFGQLGKVAQANDEVLDPVLDEIAKDLGLDLGGPLPAEARLALMTGLMAASCFVAASPDDVPEPVMTAVEIGGAFFTLNLAASAPGSAARQKKQ